MKRSIYLKCDQNPALRDKSVNTKGFLYEATLTDFWGCGMTLAQASDIGQDTIKKPTTHGDLTAQYRDCFLKGELDKFLK